MCGLDTYADGTHDVCKLFEDPQVDMDVTLKLSVGAIGESLIYMLHVYYSKLDHTTCGKVTANK